MAGQNILKNYRRKIDLKLDSSETVDFIVDTTGWVDFVLDYSETVDFIVDTTGWIDFVLDYSEEFDIQLDNTPDIDDYVIEVLYEIKEFGCDYTILTQDEFSILTQNGECIQYQH